MTAFQVKDLLNQISGALEPSNQADTFQNFFDNLVITYANYYDSFSELPFLDQIEDEDRRRRMTIMHNELYQQVRTLFTESGFAQTVEDALALRQPAFDRACAVIVSNFFENSIFSPNKMREKCLEILEHNYINPHSELGHRMLEAADRIYPEYRNLHYRVIAGPVLGYPVDPIEADAYHTHSANLLGAALKGAIDDYYRQDYDPSGM